MEWFLFSAIVKLTHQCFQLLKMSLFLCFRLRAPTYPVTFTMINWPSVESYKTDFLQIATKRELPWFVLYYRITHKSDQKLQLSNLKSISFWNEKLIGSGRWQDNINNCGNVNTNEHKNNSWKSLLFLNFSAIDCVSLSYRHHHQISSHAIPPVYIVFNRNTLRFTLSSLADMRLCFCF